jgi:hypothetical protein
MSKSKFITENKLSPGKAMNADLDAGSARISIEKNNGVIEVTNGNGAILLQSKNVPAGTWDAIWNILETRGDIEYRVKTNGL